MRTHLRERFGSDWFAKREAGSLLRELWSTGQSMDADELLEDVTGAPVEMEAVARPDQPDAAARPLVASQRDREHAILVVLVETAKIATWRAAGLVDAEGHRGAPVGQRRNARSAPRTRPELAQASSRIVAVEARGVHVRRIARRRPPSRRERRDSAARPLHARPARRRGTRAAG